MRGINRNRKNKNVKLIKQPDGKIQIEEVIVHELDAEQIEQLFLTLEGELMSLNEERFRIDQRETDIKKQLEEIELALDYAPERDIYGNMKRGQKKYKKNAPA